jgi:hypothetical protein
MRASPFNPLLLATCAALILSGCVTPPHAAEKALPAGCDGLHRRPANPNGSFLSNLTTAAPTVAADPANKPCGD